MKNFRTTEELALEKTMRSTRARRVQPTPPISDEDLAIQAALEGNDFPVNAPRPPKLSMIARLFGKGPGGIAGDGDGGTGENIQS